MNKGELIPQGINLYNVTISQLEQTVLVSVLKTELRQINGSL